MRVHWLGFVLVALLLASVTTAGLGQTSRDEVRLELERTDRALERGAEHLAEHPCIRGEELFARAKEVQNRAWAAFRTNRPLDLRSALALTRQAQKLVTEAIQSCQVDVRALEIVESLFESTMELAQEARACLAESGMDRDRALDTGLLETGLEQLEKARAEYRAKQYRPAIRLATVARTLIQRALQECRGESPSAAPSIAAAALERTDALLSEVRAELHGVDTAEARAALEQATSHQERAWEQLRAGRAGIALRWTERARDLALEATWLAPRAPVLDRVERAIEVLSETHAELVMELRADATPEVAALLDKASETLQEARERLASGQVDAAARAARLAGSLLGRAAEKAGTR